MNDVRCPNPNPDREKGEQERQQGAQSDAGEQPAYPNYRILHDSIV